MKNTRQNSAGIKKKVTNVLVHLFLTILSVIWVFPIFWVVLTSFRGEKGSYVTTFFPKTYTINNYVKLFTDTSILNFPKMFMNTFMTRRNLIGMKFLQMRPEMFFISRWQKFLQILTGKNTKVLSMRDFYQIIQMFLR